jgi:hypothetical protein
MSTEKMGVGKMNTGKMSPDLIRPDNARWSLRQKLAEHRARQADARACRTCRHFEQQPGVIESMLPGLSALSSAHASVRAEDGICALRDRYAAESSSCDFHHHLMRD